MVQSNGVEPVGYQLRKPARAVGGGYDTVAVAAQMFFDKPCKRDIVVDIQNRYRVPIFGHVGSGTFITDRNRPSCRIAVANAS